MRRLPRAAFALAFVASPAAAQESLLPGSGWGLGIGFSTWSLGTPLPL